MDSEQLKQKIEQTLSAFDGIERAVAPADLYEKLQKRLETQRKNVARIVPMSVVWRVAAAFVGVVVLNAAALFLYENRQDTEGSKTASKTIAAKAIAAKYFGNSTYNY